MDMLITTIFVLGLTAAAIVGSTPTISMSKPDEDDCVHVKITRFWEHSTILDAHSCEGMPIVFNGENIMEKENGN